MDNEPPFLFKNLLGRVSLSTPQSIGSGDQLQAMKYNSPKQCKGLFQHICQFVRYYKLFAFFCHLIFI